MKLHKFTLYFTFPDFKQDPCDYLEALSKDCNDAVVGCAQKGSIALNFWRTAANEEEAINSAIADARLVLPVGSRIDISKEERYTH